MTSTRTVRRTLLAAAALVAAFTIPAAAQQAPPPGPQGQGPAPASVVRSGNTTSPTDRVANFYGAYIDAVHDSGRSRLGGELRNHYLTGKLQQRLATWEQHNPADGVRRAQNVPTAWAVKYDKSDAGHLWSLVRLTWGNGAQRTFSYLSVQSDFAAKQISDITSIPRPAIGTGAQPHDQQRPGEQHRPGAVQ
ncbi:MAG: hypothetical protein QOF44_5532, partial [Streptomyces sp.]|nr:hypothetical protein [Streptomyces sp.]